MKLLKALGMIGGALGGGAKPAAGMDGGAFWQAAEGAGLPTDPQTLNELVDLVNQGYTPQAAASAVKAKRGGKTLQPKAGAKAKPGLLAPQGGLLSEPGKVAGSANLGLLQYPQFSPETSELLNPLQWGLSAPNR